MIADIILYAFAFVGFVATLVFVKFIILTSGQPKYERPHFSYRPDEPIRCEDDTERPK